MFIAYKAIFDIGFVVARVGLQSFCKSQSVKIGKKEKIIYIKQDKFSIQKIK